MENKKVLLKDPHELLSVDRIADENFLIEEQQLYFWVEETESNPLDWNCYFLFCKNDKKREYFNSEKITIKELNDYIFSNFEIEKYYSSDAEYFQEKVKNYTPYNLSKIAQILSNKTLHELNGEDVLSILSYKEKGQNFEILIHAYHHYSEIWLDNSILYNFYTDKEAWLKSINKKSKEFHIKNTSKISDQQNKKISEEIKSINQSNITLKNKLSLLEKNPSLKNLLIEKDIFQYFRKGNFEKISENWNEEENLYFYDGRYIIIDGDLNIKGTLVTFNSKEKRPLFDDGMVIVTGNINVENLIKTENNLNIISLGNINIENILVKNYSLYCENEMSCYTYMHLDTSVSESDDVNYKIEVNPSISAITDPKIYQIDNYGLYKYNLEYLADKILNNENFLDLKNRQKVDPTPKNIQSFISTMNHWDYYYCSLAGFEVLESIYVDGQIKSGNIYPGSGDWVVADRRGQTGTYGYSHDDGDISPVIIETPAEHGVDYKEKPIDLVLHPVELLKRYQWVSNLFIGWLHIKDPSPFGYFENVEALNSSYDKEKLAFESDPYLALYWLIHFGFTLDARYTEVVDIIKKYSLYDEAPYEIEEALSFFENTDAFYDIEINDKAEAKKIFLQRRAFLVYISQSQSYRGGENAVENWWKSIIIYPHTDSSLICRVRWLRKNLDKYNKWENFDSIAKGKEKNTCLLSYVYAFHPNLVDRESYANQFIDELFKYRNVWSCEYERYFAQIMIWDVHKWVTNKEKLKLATSYYFIGKKPSKEYKDILSSIC